MRGSPNSEQERVGGPKNDFNHPRVENLSLKLSVRRLISVDAKGRDACILITQLHSSILAFLLQFWLLRSKTAVELVDDFFKSFQSALFQEIVSRGIFLLQNYS